MILLRGNIYAIAAPCANGQTNTKEQSWRQRTAIDLPRAILAAVRFAAPAGTGGRLPSHRDRRLLSLQAFWIGRHRKTVRFQERSQSRNPDTVLEERLDERDPERVTVELRHRIEENHHQLPRERDGDEEE